MNEVNRPWTEEEFNAAQAACDPDTCEGCRPNRESTGGLGCAYLICEECRAKRHAAVAALRGA
jgi:hypothetical protein